MNTSTQTMRHIARLAGVSVATVSRVINSPEQVAPDTRERVLEIMRRQNYSYNALASGLSRHRTMTLGLIVPAITNPIFAESTRGVQEVAAAQNYALLIGHTAYELEEEARLLRVFRQHRVDGIVVTSSQPENPTLDELRLAGLPLVQTYSSRLHSQLPLVGIDNQAAATAAIDYLIQLGHTRIGMLAGTFASSDRSFTRYQGYAAALAAHTIPLDPALVVEVPYTLEQGAAGLLRLLALPEPPTAVFCSNDILAFGGLRAALDQGLSVPHDLSLVGFDDSPMAAMTNPRLTTVFQPAYEMGRKACELLLMQIDGTELPVRSVILPTELRIRETTAPPKR